MKCHYAVLGVPINADDDVIKKAYRKKALKWHPDKNIENSAEATEKFRLVQAAYDVLSDPQEKAWYDRHRNDILHRSNFASFEDETSNILDFFTPSVYRGYGDNEKGFFTVYRELFKKISMEDKQFHMSDSNDEFEEMPEFGEAESDYDEVVHLFYSSWQSYRTKLSYVWKDKYNARDAPDRRIARIIEKENKKEREKEKRKRNDLIRDLVAFVRKRDPRVKIHREELERRAELQSKKASEKRAEIMRARVEESAKYEAMNRDKMMEDASRVAQLEDLLKDEFGFSSSEESEEEWENEQEEKEESGNEEQQEELYCVACNKQFKTKMALKNHEKSKKHREKFVELQAEMSHDKYQQQEDDTSTMDEATNKPKLTKKQKKQRKQKLKLFNEYEDDDVISSDDVINPDDVTNIDKDTDDVINNDVTNTDDITTPPPEVTGATKKTKSRRRKPKNQRTTNDVMGSDITNDDITKQRSKNQQRIVSEEKPTNFCSTCRTKFPTRNKLFQHLKTTGHSKPLK
uniref:DnaJ homolog subfamily C member 21 n=1 Tax=Ciona intestinalis TaxID=7719 RepID=F7AIP5_CIOIN